MAQVLGTPGQAASAFWALVHCFADVHRIGAHLNGQSDFANQVAFIGADDGNALNLAVDPLKKKRRELPCSRPLINDSDEFTGIFSFTTGRRPPKVGSFMGGKTCVSSSLAPA